MDEVFGVLIEWVDGTKQYSAGFQTKEEYDKGWQSALKKAYQSAVVRCVCDGKGERRLAIKSSSTSGRFSLAKFPLTGHNHARACRFYAANSSLSGASDYVKGVVETEADGSITIKLGLGLKQANPKGEATATLRSGPRSAGGGQSSIRLLGLLHLLWEQSALNTWRPGFKGKRSLSGIQKWIRAVADNVNANGTKLAEVLIVPSPIENGPGHQFNDTAVTASVAQSRRLLVVAALAKCRPSTALVGEKMRIAAFYGVPKIFVSSHLWSTVTRRFRAAASAWEQGHQVMAIVQIEMRSGRGLPAADAVDMALMAVNKNWIPFESSYEMKIADLLCAGDRAFTKPLRYDADTEVVFPDFILTDTPRDTPMEVFGRTDEAYSARKEVKVAYYTSEFGQGKWWCWDAANDPMGESIPPIPPKR